MKLFIDPDDLRAQYDKSPDWLKALMNAWADGLNYYLSTHPKVRPRVIAHFEPWMALAFSEGSIGGDIERVDIAELKAFYSGSPTPVATSADRTAMFVEPTGSNGIAIGPSIAKSKHDAEIEQLSYQVARDFGLLVHLADERAHLAVGKGINAVAKEPLILRQQRQRGVWRVRNLLVHGR